MVSKKDFESIINNKGGDLAKARPKKEPKEPKRINKDNLYKKLILSFGEERANQIIQSLNIKSNLKDKKTVDIQDVIKAVQAKKPSKKSLLTKVSQEFGKETALDKLRQRQNILNMEPDKNIVPIDEAIQGIKSRGDVGMAKILAERDQLLREKEERLKQDALQDKVKKDPDVLAKIEGLQREKSEAERDRDMALSRPTTSTINLSGLENIASAMSNAMSGQGRLTADEIVKILNAKSAQVIGKAPEGTSVEEEILREAEAITIAEEAKQKNNEELTRLSEKFEQSLISRPPITSSSSSRPMFSGESYRLDQAVKKAEKELKEDGEVKEATKKLIKKLKRKKESKDKIKMHELK